MFEVDRNEDNVERNNEGLYILRSEVEMTIKQLKINERSRT